MGSFFTKSWAFGALLMGPSKKQQFGKGVIWVLLLENELYRRVLGLCGNGLCLNGTPQKKKQQ